MEGIENYIERGRQQAVFTGKSNQKKISRWNVASHQGHFLSVSRENNKKLKTFIIFLFCQKSRIIDRTAIQMSISPKFDDRYGYIVWIDEKSGLLLKSVLTDRGRAREVFQIVRLKLGDQLINQN